MSQKLNEESIPKNGIDKLGQNMSAWGAYPWCEGGGILQISFLLKTGTTVGLPKSELGESWGYLDLVLVCCPWHMAPNTPWDFLYKSQSGLFCYNT